MDHLKKLFIVLIAVAMLLTGAVFRTDVRADEGETAETTEVKEGETPEVTEAEETVEVTLSEESEEPAAAEEKQEGVPAESETAVASETQEAPVPEIVVEETPVPSEETETVTEAPAEEELPAETEETIPEEAKEELPAAAPLAVPMLKTEEVRSGGDYAYAGLNEDGNLFFFRSNTVYENDRQYSQVEDTDGNTMNNIRVFTGVEDTDPNALPWGSYKNGITDAWVYSAFSYTIAPKSTQNWFKDCPNLASFSSTGFDFNNVTSSRSMFEGCVSLQDVSVSGVWENLEDMGRMFYECSSLAYLDMSSFQTTSALNYMAQAFEGCVSLGGLSFPSIDTSGVTSMSGLFRECRSMEWLDISSFDTRNVTTMSQMFYICENLQSIYYGENFKTSKVGSMSAMYGFCESLFDSSVEIVSTFDTSKVGTMQDMFYDCKNLTQLDVSNFDTSNVESMSTMFGSCESLTSLDVSGFDTSKVTSIYSMFSNCRNLTTLDVSGFDVSKVANYGLQSMFRGCEKLNAIDVSDWDVSGIRDFSGLFDQCFALTSLDLGKWNAQNGIYFGNMFRDTSLNNIVLSKDIVELNGAALPAGTWTDGTLFLDAYALTEGYAENAEEWAGIWSLWDGMPLDLSMAEIEPMKDVKYNYNPQKNAPVIKWNGKPIKEDYYTLSWNSDTDGSECREIGTVTVTATGDGTYYTGFISTTYNIVDHIPLTNLRIDEEGILRWDPVPEAADYDVYYDDGVHYIGDGGYEGYYDIRRGLSESNFRTGDYTITVVAEDANGHELAQGEIVYHYVNDDLSPKPYNVRWDGYTVRWDITPPSGMTANDFQYNVFFYENDGFVTWKTTAYGENYYDMASRLEYKDIQYSVGIETTREDWARSEMVYSSKKPGRFTKQEITIAVEGDLLTASELIDDEGNSPAFWYIMYDNGADIYTGKTVYSMPTDLKELLTTGGAPEGTYHFNLYAYNTDWITLSELSNTVTYKYTKPVPVTGITLNKTTLSLQTGKSETLKATVSPSNADNKAVVWKSSNAAVATVDANGKVTAVKAGTATISATTKDGGKIATCKVTVTAPSYPVLVNVYNSANGADLRWQPLEGVSEYTIMRKEGGTWNPIKTVAASSLTKEGGNYKWFDEEVKEKYGKGYIYSVAVKNGADLLYDTKGLAFYRLNKPVILTVTKKSNTSVEVTWKKEECQGYELQYTADKGATWTKMPQTTETSVTLNGLDLTKNTYNFRLRIQKTNSARGTVWSQFSAWAKVGTNNSALDKPVLVNVFNSTQGADLRWKEVSGADSYVIMRKEKGVWHEIAEMSVSSLTKAGGNYKFIDIAVKEEYGAGYIYSVAVRNEKNELLYDTKGLAFYRLKAPTILSVTADGGGKATITWSDEVCQGYELQVSTDNGEHWGIHPQATATSKEITGLTPGVKYVFRVRCQKTNASRGTVWSSYSAWGKVTVK